MLKEYDDLDLDDLFDDIEDIEDSEVPTSEEKKKPKKKKEEQSIKKNAEYDESEDFDELEAANYAELGLRGESGYDDQLEDIEESHGIVKEEDLQDGSERGIEGTILNRSHQITSRAKTGTNGIKAETVDSKRLRESYIAGYKEDGTPFYNFNSGKKILDLEEIMNSGSEYVIKKYTKYMGELYFKECSKEEARDMVVCGHYSHKFQGYFGLINVGVYTQGRLVGVASFGGLMNPESYRKFGDFKKGEVIELNRLWIDDELGMNTETMILSASWKIIRKNHPEVKVVQSFADGRLGAGTIYKASNFKYYGVETTKFFQNKETKVISHKVGIENTKAPSSMCKINKAFCEGKLEQFTVNTYRYVYPLYDDVVITMPEVTKRVPMLDKKGRPVFETSIVDEYDKNDAKVKQIAYNPKTGEIEMNPDGTPKKVKAKVQLDENGKPVINPETGFKRVVITNPYKQLMHEVPDYPKYNFSKITATEEEMWRSYPVELAYRSYILSYIFKYTDEDGSLLCDFFENFIINKWGKRALVEALANSFKNDTIQEFVNIRSEAIKVILKYKNLVSENGVDALLEVKELSEESRKFIWNYYQETCNGNAVTTDRLASGKHKLNSEEAQKLVLGADRFTQLNSVKGEYDKLMERFGVKSHKPKEGVIGF